MPASIVVPKFVGTYSLGLLTGVSLTLSTLTLPALLTLPSATHARQTLSALTARSDRLIDTLSALSFLTLSFSYLFSPRQARHPYLLWTSLLSVFASRVPNTLAELVRNQTESASKNGSGSTSNTHARDAGSDSEYVTIGDKSEDGEGAFADQHGQQGGSVNGEQVEISVKKVQKVELRRAGIAAVGFAMGIVGLWGDGV